MPCKDTACPYNTKTQILLKPGLKSSVVPPFALLLKFNFSLKSSLNRPLYICFAIIFDSLDQIF